MATLPGIQSSADPLPVARPTLPGLEHVATVVRESYVAGSVTVGKTTRLFEDAIRRCCRVGHAVAVSSGTSGLILAFAAMDFPADTEVVVPSFTFAATVQALLWNRLTPVYVDCLPGTMTLDPDQVIKAITPKTVAICPVTVFGLPPDLDDLTHISRKHGIPLLCDSAQGLGSSYRSLPAGGFGLCEIFSLSPTKVITAIEGGMITTNDAALADRLRSMRDYGKGPDGEEMAFNGLSARMSELHAAVGLMSLRNGGQLVRARLRLIKRYRERLKNLPGCRVQELPPDRTSSGNYFTLSVGKGARTSRDGLIDALQDWNIHSKRYFYPPVHAQKVFRDRPHRIVGELPCTWAASLETVALPLYSHMSEDEQDRVCNVVESALGPAR